MGIHLQFQTFIGNDSLVAIDVIQLYGHRFWIMKGPRLHKIPYSRASGY